MTDTVRAITLLLHDEAERQQRQWDYPGVHVAVKAALEEDRRTAREVVLAGFEAIDDKRAQTPAALRWSARYRPAATASPADPTACIHCGRREAVHELAEAKVPPDQRHAFQSAARPQPAHEEHK